MKVVSQHEALDLMNSERVVEAFDSAKYKWTGKSADYIGKEVPKLSGVVAVYVTRRQDKDGAYAKLMCVRNK